jgi:hypothetical protein
VAKKPKPATPDPTLYRLRVVDRGGHSAAYLERVYDVGRTCVLHSYGTTNAGPDVDELAAWLAGLGVPVVREAGAGSTAPADPPAPAPAWVQPGLFAEG